MAIINTWFVVINPTSGNGLGKRKWPKIEALLKQHQFNFDQLYASNVVAFFLLITLCSLTYYWAYAYRLL